MTKVLAYLMLTGMGLLGGLVTLLLRGWVLTWLWNWFVEPFGIMSINFWHAVGVSLVIAFLTYELNSTQEEDGARSVTYSLVKSCVFSLIALLSGFVYQLFM